MRPLWLSVLGHMGSSGPWLEGGVMHYGYLKGNTGFKELKSAQPYYSVKSV